MESGIPLNNVSPSITSLKKFIVLSYFDVCCWACCGCGFASEEEAVSVGIRFDAAPTVTGPK